MYLPLNWKAELLRLSEHCLSDPVLNPNTQGKISPGWPLLLNSRSGLLGCLTQVFAAKEKNTILVGGILLPLAKKPKSLLGKMRRHCGRTGSWQCFDRWKYKSCIRPMLEKADDLSQYWMSWCFTKHLRSIPVSSCTEPLLVLLIACSLICHGWVEDELCFLVFLV